MALRMTKESKRPSLFKGHDVCCKVKPYVKGHDVCARTHPMLNAGMRLRLAHRRLSSHAIPSHIQGGALPVLGCTFQPSNKGVGGVRRDSRRWQDRSWLALQFSFRRIRLRVGGREGRHFQLLRERGGLD